MSAVIEELKEAAKDLTVLYVEDDNLLRPHMSNILKTFFREVMSAENGRAGLEEYGRGRFDMVVTDIMMPEMDGLAMSARIREKNPDQSIIIVSAYNEPRYFQHAIRLGVDGFILKPLETGQLLDTLLRTVNHVRRYKENVRYRERLEALVEKKTREIALQMITDELTGLYNRVELNRTMAEKDVTAMILLNLDNFAKINTTYGYDTGNVVLKGIAAFLQSKTPPNAALFRLTSDEFVYAFTNCSLREASDFAHHLHENIFTHSIYLASGLTVRVTATIVVVGKSQGNILQQAQVALLDAREAGRNRVFEPSGESDMETRQRHNIHWMNRVKTALETDAVIPYFQPIIHNPSGEVGLYECLCRIREHSGVVLPGMFLGPAKLVGLIPQITREMVKKSFLYFKDREFDFSINITEDDLRDGDFAPFVRETASSLGIRPDRVVFEVLENVSFGATEMMLDQLMFLREMGFRLAIDDFGAEHSNFSRIIDFSADYIKISATFIKDVHTNKKAQIIASAITNLAKSMGPKVVAEFVHCREVQDKVVELGIEYSQGFLFGKPAPGI